MLLQMYDKRSARPAGTLDVPDDVVEAALKVRAWMSTNMCEELTGLQIRGAADVHRRAVP